MPNLTDREKRTIRFAGMLVALYLLLFYGFSGMGRLREQRSEYVQRLDDVRGLQERLLPYENRVLLLEKLKNRFQLDPPEISSASLVADANAAIQEAAQQSGIKFGPIRESPGRASSGERAVLHFEGGGSIESLLQLLHKIQSLGFPLAVDTLQIQRKGNKPGEVEISLNVVLYDFNLWKKERRREA